MNPHQRADAYLTIPQEFGDTLRWSAGGDAVESRNGMTLAVAEEIVLILNGVFSRPPVPPFAFVMMLFDIMKSDPSELPATLEGLVRLSRAYTTAAKERAVSLSRNTGLLIAELCGTLPGVPACPAIDEVTLALARRRRTGRAEIHDPELMPPIAWADYLSVVALRLRKFDATTLVHWFKFGCAPLDGKEIARPLESLPDRVTELLTLARRRPRLVGAACLTAALDAALTLPPRRTAAAVPQGGYADVTTRGDPDRLLPSQFALDPDDFVRRFAEHELLYFKREEPHSAQKPHRIIVLDQGVRTWGGVRLALTAAAVLLLGKDEKRFGVARLFVSSTVDPNGTIPTDAVSLAELLEASDLTPHPASVLDRALWGFDDEAEPRDVILLTHPRNLTQPDVIAAAVSKRPADRLLTLSVDARGQAELGEWVDAGVRSIRKFRVDLAAAEAAVAERTAAPALPHSTWTGDVEPIPFPFRPGLVGAPEKFGFDADGEWVVAVGRDGVPHGIAPDGSPVEILPRAFRDGVVLKTVDAILGVHDGVVICGRMPVSSRSYTVTNAKMSSFPAVLTAPASFPGGDDDGEPAGAGGASVGMKYVAAHYDKATRQLRLHVFDPVTTGVWWSAYPDLIRWSAYPDLNCVVLRSKKDDADLISGCAVDLETLGRAPEVDDPVLVSRARLAWDRAKSNGSPPFDLPIETEWSRPKAGHSGPVARLVGNTIHLDRADPPWKPFGPSNTIDGKPLLAGVVIESALLAAHTLALTVTRAGKRSLFLFRGPNGEVANEYAHKPRQVPHTLSPDGRRLVQLRFRERNEVGVTEVATGALRVVAAHARLHLDLEVALEASPFLLTIRIGSFAHLYRVDHGQLIYFLWSHAERLKSKSVIANASTTTYDQSRFPPGKGASAGRWTACVDRLGQVLLFGSAGALKATFIVRRDKTAAWLPGGTFWGDPALIGGPPTPDAAQTFARALTDAGE
ncbi:hypothetical protein [Fimbriiglobus ruber]|uniref:Uncharacterized protein n=1 Tax=Fimbriiglobus ruber TaxID=1908690 RepID=A0A225DZD3_9BACT|nr:hypothetical protein [Fimbriiglobus ruber]OWK46343.1 hypothetical protein FRUB_00042 [Fimbriiglobus ruber]